MQLREQTLRKKEDMRFLDTKIPKYLVLLNVLLIVMYFITVTSILDISNPYLYGLLIAGQVFFTWLGLTHLYIIWNMNYMPRRLSFRGSSTKLPSVDIFITVAGEPLDIVEETTKAALQISYPYVRIYILNDGFVAKKENWRDIELLAKKLRVICITRKVPGGAKAGNINHALAKTHGDLVVIFDADHVPHPDFLEKTVPYFADPKMGFVQSPQYYKNAHENAITGGAWDQQKLYYGAICKGKNRTSSVSMCGTNMVIRRTALQEVGGMMTENIAEDFITGMFIHERGYKSVYVPKVLAEGLAPSDFLSFYKQQLRWARGSLEVFFNFNPLFRHGLSLAQKIQYLSSSSYYLMGIFVVINALMPLIFFYTRESIFSTSTMILAASFLPYIFLTLYSLQRSSSFTYTFRALVFSVGSFPIHVLAFIQTLFKTKQRFAITSKRSINGSFINLVIPHIVYVVLALVGMGYSFLHEGLTASFLTNATWAFLNIAIFWRFIDIATATAPWRIAIQKPVHAAFTTPEKKLDNSMVASSNE
jgi:cellulose synthase (UDP-forming)